MKDKPTRCIDPLIKYCQECPYGLVIFPAWVETCEDAAGCCFDTRCMYGYDQGRPEDEPTAEEFAEFEDWMKGAHHEIN